MSEWQPIESLAPGKYEGGLFLTGANMDVPGDAHFHIRGWPVLIRHDMRGSTIEAFKMLGVTHWRPLPEPPK